MKHFLISLALALSLTMTVYGQANSTGQTVILSNAVAVSGNGNSISTERWGSCRLAIVISASDTVSFEVFNGTAWTVTKNAFNVDAPTTAVNGATVSGTYIVVTNGMPFRAPVTHVSGTTSVTATQVFVTVAKAVTGGGGGGGGDALTSDPLSQFASTTSSQLASVISNETGTSLLVFNTSPTLVTPVLGVAAATSINKVTLTAPATGSTLTIVDGKTLTASNSITLAGTDSTVMTFPATSATLARTDAANTFTGVQTMTSPAVTTSLTTPSTTFALLNTTATTVDAFGVTTALNIGAGAATILNFGGHTTASEFRFLEPSGSGTNYSAFKAVAQGASITYSLPPTVGAAGTVLTDVAGDGVLTWAAGGGGGGANPAGSGSELNARLDGSTFQAVTGSSISGAVITLTGAPIVQVTDTDETTVTTLLTLFHRNVAGQPQQNYGTGILLRGNDDENSADDMAKVSTIWVDPTGGSEDSDITFQLRAGGSALAQKWRFSGLGTMTIAGTPTILASGTNAGITLTPNGSGNLLLSSGLLQSGGTNTSAFALKNNVGEMQLRLADDSAFGNMAAQAASFYQGGNRLMVITALTSFEQVSLASSVPLWWSNSATSAGGGDVGLGRLAAGVLKVNDGSSGYGWIVDAGVKRVSTQFDKTDTTLANITGLSVSVQAGRSYSFETILYTTSNIAAGVKAAIGGTATATAIIYEAETASAGVPGAVGTSRTTTLGTAVGDATAVTVAKITIRGTVVVNAAGTLTVQFAENVTNASASSVLVGSSFVVRENP